MQLQFIIPEEWRPIPNYETYYEVSTWGRVRRLLPSQGTRPGHILKPWLEHGYPRVTLSHPQKPCRDYVHRFVALVFLTCPQGSLQGFEVNHKDGNRANNSVANLEWLPVPEHKRVSTAQGQVAKGEKQHCAKLTPEAVRRIRSLRGKVSQAKLAREYGISRGTLSVAQRHKTWRHV